VSGGEVLSAAGHRLLRDPGVRAVGADRDPVVGVLLDQHGVVARQGLHWSAHGADYVDNEWRSQGHSAESLVHQGTVDNGADLS